MRAMFPTVLVLSGLYCHAAHAQEVTSEAAEPVVVNFKDANGQSAVPYLLVFKTKE